MLEGNAKCDPNLKRADLLDGGNEGGEEEVPPAAGKSKKTTEEKNERLGAQVHTFSHLGEGDGKGEALRRCTSVGSLSAKHIQLNHKDKLAWHLSKRLRTQSAELDQIVSSASAKRMVPAIKKLSVATATSLKAASGIATSKRWRG